jgi:hypothetical protein
MKILKYFLEYKTNSDTMHPGSDPKEKLGNTDAKKGHYQGDPYRKF